MKKRILSLVLSLLLILSLPVAAFADAPAVKKAEYEGSGCVDVDFTTRVQYKNLKVRVKGPDGKTVTAAVVEKDSDDLTFRIPNARPGQKYRYTISGIRVSKSGPYGKVSGTVRVPTWDPLFKEIEYDAIEKELDLEFVSRVQYKNLKVTLRDSAGKSIRCTVAEKDRTGIELAVKSLKSGSKYTITVSGIRSAGSKTYGTISGTFRVK